MTFAGQPIDLMPERAAYLPETRTLVVADLHIGKAATFRKRGIPVPSGTTLADLARLSAAVEATGCRHLLILGDLLHSSAGRTQDTLTLFTQWRQQWPNVRVVLVRGNHDRSAGPTPREWCIEEHEQPWSDDALAPGIDFLHQPENRRAGRPAMAGHLHPVASLRDFDGATLRLPCFSFAEGLMILPAFGTFTGGQVAPPGSDTYAVMGHRVLQVM